jgi:2-polyprenyl-3-methyl-5-hydroxy-6-metoxy-1,4-benzoquinol methylase
MIPFLKPLFEQFLKNSKVVQFSTDQSTEPKNGFVVKKDIDVNSLESSYSDEEIIAKANEYFLKILNPDYLIAKPFYEIAGAPSTVGNLAASLHGLDLYPGITILDFGCGTGWLTRILAQLKCNVTGLDVSSEAINIAKLTLNKLPIIGVTDPKINFQIFDGNTISQQNNSVERILCFDSFHHVRNQENILAEFYRVLKPGGWIVMSEPGPNHSKTYNAQFEMNNFHVLEKDINIVEINEIALKCKFQPIEVATYCPIPTFYGVDNFNSIISSSMSAFSRFRNFIF